MHQRHVTRRGIVAATLAAPAILGTRARAAGTIQMISHRYPALEYFAEKMRSAVPGITVNTQLMPIDKALELATIALSSKSDTLDIVYCNDTSFQTFAKNGWLRPLDDMWAKYRDEFKLDDFPESARKTYMRDGHIYVDAAHAECDDVLLPQGPVRGRRARLRRRPSLSTATWRSRSTARCAPADISCLKPVDAAINEAHWYFNALGDGWFDADWHPVFNDAKGVAGDRDDEGNRRLRAAGLLRGRERRVHDRLSAGHRRYGAAMGNARQGDGRSGEVARGRQDRLGGAAAGTCAHRRRRLCHLGVQQAGPRPAVPHHRHLVQIRRTCAARRRC